MIGTAIAIKPLSVNQAWQGRRFKTPAYLAFEKALLLLLPQEIAIPEGDLAVMYEFGLSSKQADWDNPVKPFQDVLQKKYGFDDRRIVEATVRKQLVSKGSEYIQFSIVGK